MAAATTLDGPGVAQGASRSRAATGRQPDARSGSPAAHGAPVRLAGLVKQYGGAKAVDDISLDVAPGEFVSLLGPSGSGKTTTLMMVAGFTLPDSGQVLIGNADVTREPPYRRNIGMVHQSYALFPHMSVGRNVAFPLRMRGVARAEIARRVEHALDLVQLRGFEARLPAQLSGGQQQRVALARALVFEPPLLLMDEPMGALDRKLRVELQIEIKRIQREVGSTMLYVTHDQDEALSMSDRIVVMNGGRIEQIDPPALLYEQPRTRYVAAFLGTSNFLDATIVAGGDRAIAVTAGGLRTPVSAGAGRAVGQRLVLSIRPERIRISQLGSSDPALLARGTVAEVSFFGAAQRYLVDLGGGDTLIVTRPSLGEPLLAQGTPVGVSWGEQDAWVIPEACP